MKVSRRLRGETERQEQPGCALRRTKRPEGWRLSAEDAKDVRACRYLAPQPAIIDFILTRKRRNKSRPNFKPRTASYAPYLSDDEPGRPAQGILQVPLVEFQRQRQQVVGIVQELLPIDFGTDHPLLPA